MDRRVAASRAERRRSFRRVPSFEPLEMRWLRASIAASAVPVMPLSASAWTSVGPAPILDGQVPGNGPVTGRIRAVVPDPADPSTLYIAADGGGVWKSADGGTSWTPLTDHVDDGSGNPVNQAMGALAVARSSLPSTGPGGEILYAGLESEDTQGVLVSFDSGASWTLENDGGAFAGLGVDKLVVDPTDPTGETVYAMMNNLDFNGVVGGQPGIYKSSDGGRTWIDSGAGISTDDTFTDFVVDPSNGLVLYAAVGPPMFQQGASGIYKSLDGGGTWTELSGGAPSGDAAGNIAMAISPSDPQTLFAVSTDPTTGAFRVVRTADGGTAWTDATGNVKSAGPPYLIAIDPTNPSVVFLFGGGQYAGEATYDAGYDMETTDGGASWNDISIDPAGNGPHIDDHAFAFDASGDLLMGNDGGLWELTKPTSLTTQRWIDLNGNLDITEFYGVALDPTDAGIAYAGSQDQGIDKVQAGVGWVQLQQGDGGYARVDPSHPGTVYMEIYGIDLKRSDDGGQTFTEISPGFDLQLLSWGDGSGVPTTGQNLVIAGTDSDGLLHIRTFDSARVRTDTYEALEGGTLHLVSADASGNVLSDAAESSLSAAATESITDLKQQLPGLLPPHVLTQAEDTQVNFEATTITGETLGGKFFIPFVLNPSDPSEVLYGTATLYQSTDRGQTWTSIGDSRGVVQPVRRAYRRVGPVGHGERHHDLCHGRKRHLHLEGRRGHLAGSRGPGL